jgi:hypothetical protein
MVIWALSYSNTILIPFIIDPFGGLGPIANHCLFGLRPDLAPGPLHFWSTTSQQIYKNTMSLAAPIGLLHQADQYWSHNSSHFASIWLHLSCLVPNELDLPNPLVPTSTKHLPNTFLKHR